MAYYFVIALQIFCFVHLFRTNRPYYWFFIILLIPLIGSLVYIITQVVNSRDVTTIAEGVSNIINPTKKILDLEKQIQLADTFQNRVNLGDAYLENKDYENAIKNYLIALDGNFKNDPYTINNLITCYFYKEEHEKVIEYSERILNHSEFKKSHFFYGISLENTGRLEEAEVQLRKTDLNYSNYKERVELAEFLIRHGKNDESKVILSQIMSESLNMTKTNQRLYRTTILRANNLLSEIS